MEETGARNRIHASKACADHIVAAGKQAWVKEREGQVVAKGKGVMQTFWIVVKDGRGGSHLSESSAGYLNELPDGDDDRKNRLIHWNVEHLVSVLKQVIARRQAEMKVNPKKHVPAKPFILDSENTLAFLDDVKEIIELPEYDDKVVARQVAPEDIKISAVVFEELQNFVAAIAELYNDNPFHNFEHASAGMISKKKCFSIFFEFLLTFVRFCICVYSDDERSQAHVAYCCPLVRTGQRW